MKLFLTMLLFVCSTVLFGQGVQPPGAGTEEYPYLMSEFGHLVWFSETEEAWGSYFLQIADIDASESVNLNDGTGWNPIGYSYHDDEIGFVWSYFTGVYNGQTFEISNIFLNSQSNEPIGFFRFISSGLVTNLKLSDVDFTGYSGGILAGVIISDSVIDNVAVNGIISSCHNTGGIAASISNSSIKNSSSNVIMNVSDLISYAGRIGGFVGESSNARIQNCTSTLEFYSEHDDLDSVGGFIGRNGGEIFLCQSESYITLNGGSDIGGFVGSNDYDIVDCHSYTEIESLNNESLEYVGGFVGKMRGSDADNPAPQFPEIAGCSAKGFITGSDYTGGFIGSAVFCFISNSYTMVDIYAQDINNFMINLFAGEFYVQLNGGINRSYTANRVIGSDRDAGFTEPSGNEFWVGYDNYVDYEVAEINPEVLIHADGMTTAQMKDVATYTQVYDYLPWDFVGDPYADVANWDVWDINPEINDGYPYLTYNIIATDNDDLEDSIELNTVSEVTIHSLYPNPFNPTTTISYTLKQASNVNIEIYNIIGQKVYTKDLAQQSAGSHNFTWDGVNNRNSRVASGLYLFRIKTDKGVSNTKGIVMK